MDITIPIKKTSLYSQPLGLRIEKKLKDRILLLERIEGENKPDVPELLRMGLRAVVEMAIEKYKINP